MKALVVGAGAVGQVYARHLQLGGAEVHLFVKAKYSEDCRRGFAMYPLNRRDPRAEPVTFKPDGVITTPAEAAARGWDQIYLCMSSTGLRGDWLEEFAKAIPGATVVMLQPGLDDLSYLSKYVEADRIVSGMISLISYQAPLPGERVPRPGMAYWFPPLSPSPFSGHATRARAVAAALNAGGLPAKVVADVPRTVAYPSAALMALISALEVSDWSFDKLGQGTRLREACAATAEAAAVVSRRLGRRSPLGFGLVMSPLVLRTVLKIAPRVIPLDLETYLKVHFTKVGDQTRMYMKGYLESGRELGMPVHALESLTNALPPPT